MGLICPERFPLFGGKHSAQAEEHAGVRFFQFCSRLGHVVNLGQDLALVRLIRRKQGLHRHLLFSHSGAKIHQAGTTLLEDCLHSLLLV
jgi:hypothetical protein